MPAPVLTAFWGLESDFGANFGNYKILSALATLAYDCRRADFFRTQLFDALRIIQRGDQRVDEMIGDWAGEFGGMQFTASDYLKNAVDFDGDGRRDLIKSMPDTLASGRQLPGQSRLAARPALAAGSARAGRTCRGRRPTSPSSIRSRSGRRGACKPAHGALPPAISQASLILPMGRYGPAFLAYPNFKAFLGWNSAIVYSTTVAYFATRIAGAPAVSRGSRELMPLSAKQMQELQRLLNQQGYERRRNRRQIRLGHARRGQEGADQGRPAGGFLSDRRIDRSAARQARGSSRRATPRTSARAQTEIKKGRPRGRPFFLCRAPRKRGIQ